jgi:hypothetical protein
MRRIVALVGGAIFALAGCGSLTGGNDANAVAQEDVAQERMIPCTVQAHGISEVERTLRYQPERPPCDNNVDPQKIALDELIRIIPDQHPAFYYILAARLFAANRKDEAVFWFYAGQLRYRIRLACHPDLPPGTEPALLASLQEEVGRPINEYAGADPDAWVAAITRARDWDAATRNGYEPKAPCRAQIADQRNGMAVLIDQLAHSKDQIRAERSRNGLPNR